MLVMRRDRGARAARTTALAVLAAVGALVLPAAAGPAQAAAGPEGQLWLGVVRGTDAGDPATTWAMLTCDPDGGTHPRGAAACTALRQVGGDIAALPTHDTMCTKVYAPVVAEAVGDWGGTEVSYRKTYANACEMAAQTGAVFALGSD